MMDVRTTLHRTDWAMLAKQKRLLLEIQAHTTLYDDQRDAIDGIINWIDAIQDAAENEGYPVVFLTEDAE